MLGQFTREEEPDSGLDLPGGDGGPLVVVSQTAGLSSDSLKEIVDERVHDAHGLGGDTSVGVDLLQDLVDVDGVGLLPLVPLLLLVALGDGLGGLAGLLGSFSRNLGRHDDTGLRAGDATQRADSVSHWTPDRRARAPLLQTPGPARSSEPGKWI